MAVESALRISPWRDYLSLAKPRVVGLHLLTAAAAMFLAGKGFPNVVVFLSTLVGGALAVGASNCLNCYLDIDLDRNMPRTRQRPLPSGRIRPLSALLLAATCGGAGLVILSLWVNWFAVWLTLGALAYYVVVYTLWLKRRSYWSSVVGSGAGAFPPLIGWVAVTGRVEFVPWLLFAVVVLWTLPHFWSLVIFKQREYAGAGLAAIPAKAAPLWILISSTALLGVSLLISRFAEMSWLYTATAVLAGLILWALAGRLFLKPVPRNARSLYWFSIFYLAILFLSMALDKVFLK